MYVRIHYVMKKIHDFDVKIRWSESIGRLFAVCYVGSPFCAQVPVAVATLNCKFKIKHKDPIRFHFSNKLILDFFVLFRKCKASLRYLSFNSIMFLLAIFFFL